MPRHRRLFLPDMPLHIVQRGHDRKPVFIQPEDFDFYLTNLREAKDELGIRVFGYCLMTNHVHLAIAPGFDTTSVSKFLRLLAARHTRHVNKLERRTGTLWEGRFKSSLIDTDGYLLSCLRYIDLNPVRAGMVDSPCAYRWSTYRTHVGLASDHWLDECDIFRELGRTSMDRALAYKDFVSKGDCAEELLTIRSALRRNQVTGNDRFRDLIAARTGRRISNRAPGRPRIKGST
ncbi:MAG TPA: transposase [Woeseiaceae bacterium]|jgi:putative transposase